MGDYFRQTMQKCVLGTVDAVIHGRGLSPSTQENCAVAQREFEEALKNPPEHQENNAKIKAREKLDKVVQAKIENTLKLIKDFQEYAQKLRASATHKH